MNKQPEREFALTINADELDAAGVASVEFIEGEPPTNNLGIHLQHCNFGEHAGACKYGDEDCPALTDSWEWFGIALQQINRCEDCGTMMNPIGKGIYECWKCVWENAGRKVENAKAQLGQLQREKREAEVELDGKVKSLEAQLTEANASNAALCEQIGEMTRNATRLRERFSPIEAQLAEANARAEAAEKQLADFERYIDEESMFLSKDDFVATAVECTKQAEARAEAAEGREAKMRAILEGAGYDDLNDLDDTLTRDIEDCRRVGETVGDIVQNHIESTNNAHARAEKAESRAADLGEECRKMTDEIERLSVAVEWVLGEIREKIAVQPGLKTATIQEYFQVYKRISIGFYDKDVAKLQAALNPDTRQEACLQCGAALAYDAHIEQTGETRQEVAITGAVCLNCGAHQSALRQSEEGGE